MIHDLADYERTAEFPGTTGNADFQTRIQFIVESV
jgi:hypothetical protein